MEDEKYYKDFLEGNQDAFETLVLKYKDNLIYFLYRYVNDMIEAEDLAQDAFVEVLVHKERFNFKTSFKTYLFTIGRNKAIDYVRKANRNLLYSDVEVEKEEESTLEDKIILEEEKKLLNKKIKQLKPDYQAAISLIDFEELSYQETAKILGKTIPQTKVLIHRARKGLRKLLEQEGYVHEK